MRALLRAAREREARALQAIGGERARIAWELHDVLAHALGVIVMETGGAGAVGLWLAVGPARVRVWCPRSRRAVLWDSGYR